ncbi:MAG TPA: lipopolysaccharide biosynthesis protein [Chloroflexota bacterium]|jgi:O-antigen/teichoic acid export membrane protein|nr:lipopolysaccharide biosynthesis protein [Chloroflexota bacterium]
MAEPEASGPAEAQGFAGQLNPGKRALAPGHLGRTVIFNVGLTVVGLISAGLVPFGFNLAVGRIDGASTLGLMSVALGLALFLGQIPGTISSAATKFIAESLGAGDEERARGVFQYLAVITAGLALALGLALLALAPVLESVYHLSFTVILLAAALIPTYTMYLFFKSCYYGFGRVRTYLVNEVVSDCAFFGGLAAVFVFGATPLLLLPFVVNNAVFAVIALRDMMPDLRGFRMIPKPDRGRIIRYCLINGGGSSASLGRWFLGTAIAGLFLSHHSVGLFAAALAITAPLPLLPRAISLVTFALMARLHGAGEHPSVQIVLKQSTEWLVFALGVPSGLAIINASALISFAFRPSFASAALATQLIIGGAYITDISRPSIDALSSTLWVRIATLASFLGLAASLVIWLALIPRYGISAAGLGFAAGALVTAVIPAYYACKHIGSSPIVFARPAIMLAGLALLTALGPSRALIASIVFVGGASILYVHLIEMIIRFLARSFGSRPSLAEESA